MRILKFDSILTKITSLSQRNFVNSASQSGEPIEPNASAHSWRTIGFSSIFSKPNRNCSNATLDATCPNA